MSGGHTLSPQLSFFGCLILTVLSLAGFGYYAHSNFFVSTAFLIFTLISAYGAILAARDAIGPADPYERALHNQAIQIARAFDLPSIPRSFNEYDGFFEEMAKRVKLGITVGTNEKKLTLMRQANAAYVEIANLKRAEATLNMLDQEQTVKSLELQKQKHALLEEIERHKKAIKVLTDTSQKRRSSRSILHEEDDDE